MTHKILLGMILSVFNATAGFASNSPEAWLETSSEQGRLFVNAHVKTARTATLEYELISQKSGKSGNSKTRQAGKVNAEAGETYPLTKLRLGLASEDKYTLTLNVYEKGELVAEDTTVFP